MATRRTMAEVTTSRRARQTGTRRTNATAGRNRRAVPFTSAAARGQLVRDRLVEVVQRRVDRLRAEVADVRAAAAAQVARRCPPARLGSGAPGRLLVRVLDDREGARVEARCLLLRREPARAVP